MLRSQEQKKRGLTFNFTLVGILPKAAPEITFWVQLIWETIRTLEWGSRECEAGKKAKPIQGYIIKITVGEQWGLYSA